MGMESTRSGPIMPALLRVGWSARRGKEIAMTRRLFTTLVITLVAPALTSMFVPAQAPATTSVAGGASSSIARTPWGHPDIAGVWSSDDMRGIPRERPDEFGTRRFLTDEEYAKRVERDEQSRKQEGSRVGAFRNDVGTRTCRQTAPRAHASARNIPA